MGKDLIYIFDKTTKKRSILGEIQSDFNMSITIDGTKDSLSIIVMSYSDYEIEPYTILWHEKTNTWWIVSHDKIERYQNEQGFLYIHELELLGAIELLNARDLTDCGFNDNTYTVFSFIKRLFNLSNFDIPLLFNNSIDNNFLNKNVDFIKTFENYTLLSALREFLDAYNMCPKLTFDTHYVSNEIELHYARLNIIPKTGDSTLTSHSIDDFDDVKETKIMDKESFGTCVVSNSENVISNREKIYPSIGGTKLSSRDVNITAESAIIRLPSKVFKGNWIKMFFSYMTNLYYGGSTGGTTATQITYQPNNPAAFETYKEKAIEIVNNITGYPAGFKEKLLAALNNNWDYIQNRLNKAATITMYDGNKVVPTFSNNTATVEIQKGNNVPYIAQLRERIGLSNYTRKLVFCEKNVREMLPLKKEGIAWERGSDIISGFDIFDDNIFLMNLLTTDLQENTEIIYEFRDPEYTGANDYFRIYFPIPENGISLQSNLLKKYFEISYIPMTDIKIKVDNQRTKKDTQLYNQNGRITDNFALSKLLNSYSKEISSDTITRCMHYTDLDKVPKIGSFVYKNNDIYVINNISMSFTQCESNNESSFNYYIDCEFTMSKWVSTKSLMVNPNTNIRDYGIPQNFNVKRKQLYRDYYELNYNLNDDNESTYYLDAENIFTFGHEPTNIIDFIAILKLNYDSQIGSPASSSWYYQLETINYSMNKMLYIIIDFKDNNIIGYGGQNVWSGFDVSRIFTGLTDNINTPIQYTDDNGKVKDILIKLGTIDAVTDVYKQYQIDNDGDDFEGSLFNYSVFIPSYIYDNVESSIDILEENYRKDALEVPVFEYACQIDDSDDVLIGDNILTQYQGNIVYFYGFVFGNNLTQYNVNDSNNIIATTHPIGWSQANGVSIEYENFTSSVKLLRIRFYNWQRWDVESLGFSNGADIDISQLEGKDIAIFRKAFDLSAGQVVADDLLFIAKKVPSTNVSQDGLVLTLQLNHYKLN